MKILAFIPVIAVLFLSTGCTQNTKKPTKKEAAILASPEQCYRAVFEKDTAYLNFRSPDTSTVEGRLLIRYSRNPENNGEIKGHFSGDTLFADYTYTVGTYKDRINKNPLAFLKKGDSLILGIGEIETFAGRAYFKPGAPIHFEKGRFRFVKQACK